MSQYDPNDPRRSQTTDPNRPASHAPQTNESYVEPVEKRASSLPLIMGVLLVLALAYFVLQRVMIGDEVVVTDDAAEVETTDAKTTGDAPVAATDGLVPNTVNTDESAAPEGDNVTTTSEIQAEAAHPTTELETDAAPEAEMAVENAAADSASENAAGAAVGAAADAAGEVVDATLDVIKGAADDVVDASKDAADDAMSSVAKAVTGSVSDAITTEPAEKTAQ